MLLLLFALFPLLLPPPIAALSPPAADASALLSFKSAADPAGNRLPFLPSTPPCTWPGITCSTNQRVTRLLLQNLSLNGTFPNSTLTRLNQLRLLSLKSNSISGHIPDLTPLFNLKALFLSHNLLSGPFPVSVVALHRLRTLDLSHNFLTGSIPSGLALLDRLYSFRLDSNRVSGPVPFMNQSSLKVFNVSGNDLSGAVPVTVVLSSFGAGAFDGNVRLCGAVVRRECGSRLDFFKRSDLAPGPGRVVEQGLIFGERRRRRKKKKGVLEGGLFACGVILATVLIGVCLVVREKRKRGMMGKNVVSDVGVGCEMDGSGEREGAEEVEERCKELVAAAAEREEKMKRMGRSGSLVFCGGEVEVYSMEELMRASAEMLGRGSVGSTYKAVLDNRMVVCVKRLDGGRISESGKEGFERHMEVVGRLRHGNLVPLRAFFQAKEERLLVYDYQPNGSLYSLIHGSRSTKAKPLHWTSCLKIAEDVAQGLAYIHQASRLVHGNIRSTNVLLGSDFEARLADNCLASLVEPPVGTDDNSGYRAPETARKPDWQPTPKSDIFSFGALLLELLTGKPPQFLAAAADLPNWVRSARDDEGADEERLRMIVGVAAACVRPSPESRPTAWQVLKMIQEVKEADVGDDDGSDSCVS